MLNDKVFMNMVSDMENSRLSNINMTIADIDWQKAAKKMRMPAWLFDARSICDIQKAKLNGINVWRIGAGVDLDHLN